MNSKEFDECMKIARILAYGAARDEGLSHFQALVMSKEHARHRIDMAYQFLGFDRRKDDVRDKL